VRVATQIAKAAVRRESVSPAKVLDDHEERTPTCLMARPRQIAFLDGTPPPPVRSARPGEAVP
jgi:hypothetical protein